MFLALIPAMLLPFELFLFVYAFLGPLHYFTEINWLHKKNYFTTQKHDYLLIVAITLAVCILTILPSGFKQFTPFLLFITLAIALSMVLFNSYIKKLAFTLVLAIAGFIMFRFFDSGFTMFFSNLLPSIVHVFIFTGAFIILGSLKSKSKLGMMSAIVFITCAIITLFASPRTGLTRVDENIFMNYRFFKAVNESLINFFSFMQVDNAKIAIWAPTGLQETDKAIFFSGTGIKIMRFLAFAYTYHYLNWFSKTSVIQWHNTRKINLVVIFLLWIGSIVLYSIDYKLGLQWLYAISLAHVTLEFPLNHRSFIEIKQQVALKFSK